MAIRTVLPPFAVTASARCAIEELGGAVRVDVEDGGCCGRTYVLALVDPESPTVAPDARYGCPGAWLVVSPQAEVVLTGAELDYAVRLRPPRFRILRNPNTVDVCPCRRSFGAPWPGPRQPTCRSYAPMPWDEEFDPPRAWRRQTEWGSLD